MASSTIQDGCAARRGRWWLKRLLAVVALVVLMAVAGAGLLLTPAAGVIIRPQLERALGVRAEGGSLRLNLSGDIVIRNVTFLTPEGPGQPQGDAARFLTINRGQILLWWRAKLRGQALVRRVEVFDSSVRLTKPLDDFDLNILAIEPPQGDGAASQPLPSIVVHKASVLLGEHNADGDVSELRTLAMIFSLRASREQEGAYDVTAVEDAALSSSVKPIRFEGRIGPDGFSGKLGSIDLADFPPETIPQQLRDAYTDLAAGGRTRGATVRYDQALDVLELVLDFQQSSPFPAPFSDDSTIAAELNLRLPVPTDEQGTLQPLIPASGSGLMRLVQRPSPRTSQIVPWRSLQAPAEPGEPGPGKRTLMIQGRLQSTIEDARVSLDVNMWLGGAEPLYEFEVATLEPYSMGPETAWLGRPAPVLGKISQIVELLQSRGTVSLFARASQVADGNGVRQQVAGSGTLRNGSLRFKYFPYPVQNVSGSLEIDNGRISLVGLRGNTPSGAQVLASTTITLDKVATGVEVDVRAFGVPYDNTMRETLDRIAPEIREIILNESALAELRSQGLVRGQNQPGRGPTFELGGEADAHVRVTRQAGFEGSTTVRVEARSTRFGLLPEAFPVPVVANDVLLTVDVPPELETTAKGRPRLVRIESLNAGATSLAGGSADVSVVVAVPIDEPRGRETSTTVDLTVDARRVPIHPALLAAVPEGDDGGTLPGGPRRVLQDLRPQGNIDTLVRVLRESSGEIDWWAEVSPQGAMLVPAPVDARSPLTVEELTGRVRIDGQGLSGDVAGRTRRGGEIRANLRADFDEDTFLAVFSSLDLNLESPVEDAIAVVAPDFARSLNEARNQFDIRGEADVAANVRVADGDVAAEVRVARVDRLRLNWLDGRLGLDNGRGTLVITTTPEGPLATLDRVLADGTFNSEPIGRVRLRGEIPIDALREQGSTFDRPTLVNIEVQGATLESQLLRSLASNRGGDGFESVLDQWDLRGEYDALVALQTPAYDGTGSGARPLRQFELSPYNASILRDGVRVELPWVSGVIAGRELTPSEAGPGGVTTYVGQIDNLTLGDDDWWLGLDGYWRADGGSQTEFEVSMDGVIRPAQDSSPRRHGIPIALLGFMPPGVVTALDAMAINSTGVLRVEEGMLRVTNRQLSPTRYEVQARLAAETVHVGTRRPTGDSREVDVPARVIGVFNGVGVTLTSDTNHPSTRATLQLLAGQSEIWNLISNDIGLSATVGRDGVVDLSELRLNAGGGRIAGRGRVILPGSSEEPARYELELAGAGLDTGRVIAALQDREPDADRGAGDLDLSLGLEGSLGETESLRGRGSMRIRGGSPVELPVAIRAAVEALNVNFGADRYDAVNGEFFIQDRELTFTRLSVGSDSVVLDGLGTVDLGSGALDMTITSRSTSDSAFRSLVRYLREVIVGVDLRGTLDNPVPAPRPQALVGPLDRLRRVIQGGLNYEEWQKERLRRYARQQGEPESGW